jgi:hypothetical protein
MMKKRAISMFQNSVGQICSYRKVMIENKYTFSKYGKFNKKYTDENEGDSIRLPLMVIIWFLKN